MGAEQSKQQDPQNETLNTSDIEDINGFQILKVKDDSPAKQAGLTPYFDYIVAIDGQNTIYTTKQFSQIIQKSVNSDVKLHVYSTKTNKLRHTVLTPSLDWNTEKKEGLLGCSIRFVNLIKGMESVWHILDIEENSPADKGGLNAFSDYIIGSELKNIIEEEDLYNLIGEYKDKVLSLLVYNKQWDTCRDVVIIPNNSWGGEGLLGCNVGYGYLHRIPTNNEQDLPNKEQPIIGEEDGQQPKYSTHNVENIPTIHDEEKEKLNDLTNKMT